MKYVILMPAYNEERHSANVITGSMHACYISVAYAHKPFLVCERLLLRFFHLLLPMLDKGVTHRDVRIDGRLLEGLIIPDLE
jgi:hypothetical protein